VVEHRSSPNGSGDGYSHNLYIGQVKSFTLRFSYVTTTRGHNVKSGLEEPHHLNRIMDEKTADQLRHRFAERRLSFVIGNVIPAWTRDRKLHEFISYARGLQHPVNELYSSTTPW